MVITLLKDERKMIIRMEMTNFSLTGKRAIDLRSFLLEDRSLRLNLKSSWFTNMLKIPSKKGNRRNLN